MRLDEIGEIDGWRCWLCDEPVDPDMSVNDPRGPSIDSRTTERAKAKAKGTGKGKGKGTGQERLAHRACNTGKGAVEPGGAVARRPVHRRCRRDHRHRRPACHARADARSSVDAPTATTPACRRAGSSTGSRRLEPDLDVTSEIEAGGGQYLVILRS